jgi:hypothetical protein
MPFRSFTRRPGTATLAAAAMVIAAILAGAAILANAAAPARALPAADICTAQVGKAADSPLKAAANPPRALSPAAPDGIALAGPDAAAVAVPSSPDAWGGIRTGREPTLSDRVVRYDIDATLDPVKHRVDGRERLTWRNRSSVPVRSVYLHLYLNAFEGMNSTFMQEKRDRNIGFPSGAELKEGQWGHIALRRVDQGGAPVAWGFVHPDGGPALDHTVVRLDLPAAVAPGASTALDIDFAAQLPRVVARTGWFGSFHLVAQWFPKIAVLELPGERGATAPRWNAHEFHFDSEFYADFGSYDVRLTVPKGYTVGATGERQGAPVERGGMLTHRFVQDDVHDFAWTADRRTAPPLVDTWHGAGSPPVTVTVLYPPEYAATAAPALKATKDSLTWFSKTLGPYPYRTVTVVIPPYNAEEAGGMEYPTFYTIAGWRTLDPRSFDQYDLDFVTIHEFGHGYFYGLLASNEFEEPLLDEGLNQYWDNRMLRDRGQGVYTNTPLLSRLGFQPRFPVFDFDRMAALGATSPDPADAPGANAWHRLQGIGPVYVRSATVLRDLEAELGAPAIERAFREYYRRWKFRHPSTADLRETLAETTGRRDVVERVFARQLMATARVDDRIGDIASTEVLPQPGTRETPAGRVEDKQADIDRRVADARKAWKAAHPQAPDGTGPYPWRTDVVVRRRGAAVPQVLVVRFADGSAKTVAWDADEKWRRFSFTGPARAVSAQLDPRQVHYLDVDKLDDGRTLDPDPSASRRWSLDVAAIWLSVLSLIANL